MKDLKIWLLAIALMPVEILIYGFVYSEMWAMFVAPLVGFPITIAQAGGLHLTLVIVKGSSNEPMPTTANALVSALIANGVTKLFGLFLAWVFYTLVIA